MSEMLPKGESIIDSKKVNPGQVYQTEKGLAVASGLCGAGNLSMQLEKVEGGVKIKSYSPATGSHAEVQVFIPQEELEKLLER